MSYREILYLVNGPAGTTVIKIDFRPGTHGNFLEYVSNIWIMQTDPGHSTLFTHTGASHNADNSYRTNRLIKSGHFTTAQGRASGLVIGDSDTVIQIGLDDLEDNELFLIALTNLVYRAGDIGYEGSLEFIPEQVRSHRALLRNDWYSKFNENSRYLETFSAFDPIPNPVFNFPLKSFYSYGNFCTKLNELAFFLDQTFFPDERLYKLYQEFMTKNHGWHSYKKCSQLLEDVLGNKSSPIDCDSIEEAWLNYMIAQSCRLYTGPMFDNDSYPADAQEIYAIIQQHLETLRTE